MAARRRLGGLTLFSSYHCSRYNTNTRVLTPEMFGAVFAAVRKHLDHLAKRPRCSGRGFC